MSTYAPQVRSLTKLPLAFYRNPSVEEYDLLTRRILNRPDQLVESDGGLLIPFKEYRRQVEAACITALTTKAADWHYEQEVRFIYDLDQLDQKVVCENGRHFVTIPPDALRKIIVGFRANVELVREIVRLFRAGQIGVVHVYLAAPDSVVAQGMVLFPERSAAILPGPAIVQLAFPFHVERLPSGEDNYWRDLRLPHAQFLLRFQD